MDIGQNSSIIEECFDHYEKIQLQHLHILQSNTVPDLNLMTRDREKIFQILKTNLETMMENAGLTHRTDSISDLGKYENRLNAIMKLDEAISIEIKKYRDTLKTNLNRMKKGKAAMNGYRMAGTTSPNPHVLSMNR